MRPPQLALPRLISATPITHRKATHRVIKPVFQQAWVSLCRAYLQRYLSAHSAKNQAAMEVALMQHMNLPQSALTKISSRAVLRKINYLLAGIQTDNQTSPAADGARLALPPCSRSSHTSPGCTLSSVLRVNSNRLSCTQS